MRDDAAAISGTIEGIDASSNLIQDSDGTDPGAPNRLRIPPRSTVHVYCIPMPDSDGTFTEVWVAPDGTFHSPPLAPGVYRVLAFETPQRELEYRNPEAMQEYDSKGPIVRVEAGQNENVRVQLIARE
jgi:hypothetical protein